MDTIKINGKETNFAPARIQNYPKFCDITVHKKFFNFLGDYCLEVRETYTVKFEDKNHARFQLALEEGAFIEDFVKFGVDFLN